MLDRICHGEVPEKPHTMLKSAAGRLRYEECLTRAGFEGAFSILYHVNRPHAASRRPTTHGWTIPRVPSAAPGELARRHYVTEQLERRPSAPLDARIALLFNEDVTLSVAYPERSDPAYFVNADADDLFFVDRGQGTVRSAFGDLTFSAGDYVCIPRGVIHRLVLDENLPHKYFYMECHGALGLLRQWRNELGQLRMDAPYSHRDFRRPSFSGPTDEGIRHVVVKRQGGFHTFEHAETPLDVVGFDGTVYPWAFPILAFQPRVSSIHLPPTWHGTFQCPGALICSFVPRPLDFHPQAIPCPYPHSSVDIDEVLYYVSGDFTSRQGVVAGSITHHPAGLPHGPHPGNYEASVGKKQTNELAVMLDCARPLYSTEASDSVEDDAYDASFLER